MMSFPPITWTESGQTPDLRESSSSREARSVPFRRVEAMLRRKRPRLSDPQRLSLLYHACRTTANESSALTALTASDPPRVSRVLTSGARRMSASMCSFFALA